MCVHGCVDIICISYNPPVQEVICASTYVWEARHNTGHHAYTNLVSETGGKERTFESDPDVFSTFVNPISLNLTPNPNPNPNREP